MFETADDQVKRRKAGDNTVGQEANHRDRWLVSYADLMTLLFALFAVLYAAADRDRAQAVAAALSQQIAGAPAAALGPPGGSGVLPGSDSVTEARAAVEWALAQNELLRARARVLTTGRGFVVSLAEAGFFAAGEAAVRDDARGLIDTLADSLSGARTQIRVEGHTDATPIATARYPSNWELSSARASKVLAQLVARGIAPARLSVAGYASERPVADNNTLEGRALNRRVDLVILNTEQ
ncbi:MAG: OmpA family protein [Acidobacteria bacterium]|nr:OmpA family protein [Acidobacteriota bacterium]MBI3425662.1 OmpA family protein [Acidobacteriota bacterium]